jgi:hypothetical protein
MDHSYFERGSYVSLLLFCAKLLLFFLLLCVSLKVRRYGQFLDGAIVDGRIRTVNFSLNDDWSVTATLPHFWIDAGKEGKQKKKKKTS